MGSMFSVLCRSEVGRKAGTSGRCIDDSEVLRVDIMEFELVGGECITTLFGNDLIKQHISVLTNSHHHHHHHEAL